jgi:ATP-dependent DNA helicase DinG
MADSARSAASRTTSLDEWRRLLGGRVVTSALSSLARSGRNGEAVLEHLGACNREVEVLFGSISFRYRAGKTFFTADPKLLQTGQGICHAVTAVLRPLAFLDDMEDEELSEEKATLAAWRDELKEALDALSWCLAVEKYPEWAYWWDGTSLQSAPTLCSEQIREGVERCAPHAVVVASATLSLAGDLRFWKRETAWSRPIRSFSNPPFPCGSRWKSG